MTTLPVLDTMNTAWHKVKGAKGTFWGASFAMFPLTILYVAISSIVMMMFFPTFGSLLATHDSLFLIAESSMQATLSIYNQVWYSILIAGTLYIGMNRAIEVPISYKQVFYPFKSGVFMKIVLFGLIQALMLLSLKGLCLTLDTLLYTLIPSTNIHTLILALISTTGGIYIFLATIISLPLIIDKKMNTIEAIKLSFKATRGNMLACIGIYLLLIPMMIISVITLGLGFIWTFPFISICRGVIYQRLMVNCQ